LSESKYIIGIDLGTTHCVTAYTEPLPGHDHQPEIRIFMIPQVVDQGEVKALPLLPSFIFLPGHHDLAPHSLTLPWNEKIDLAVGEFARKRGADIPNRLIFSAKSWLCHHGVDRTAPILPWGVTQENRRLSPVDASRLLLEHIRDAWNDKFGGRPEGLFENQEIYLTVPASFDAVARELTVKAASEAGLGQNFTLLEEPQAAFYAWIDAQGEGWRESVSQGDSILVCDVGGGTTDFSLIQVEEEDGRMILRRVAVGDHILLGGDNMDLTLAYTLQKKLMEEGVKLDNWQFRGLGHSCRLAKERLLLDPEKETEPVVILGRGSSLIGGTLRTELTRAEVENTLINGFLPRCGPDEYPRERPRIGMREMGLPYEADPAITRHLARFLGRQIRPSQDSETTPYPTAVLFNGGVMKPEGLRHRIGELLRQWSDQDIRELASPDLDLAVARGAAYYGLARRGRGIRIRGGAPKTYYIGIESAMPAVPGVPSPMKALCIVPFGMEEGTRADIREREFGLFVGQPAEFHLLASTTRQKDQAGEVVEDWAGEIEEVTTMQTTLSGSDTEEKGTVLPVWLESGVTEIGTLDLWCVKREEEEKRWKLEFNLREHTPREQEE
jgi:hypothetical protein